MSPNLFKRQCYTLFAAIGTLLASQMAAAGLELHVSPNGNDGADGSLAKPFATPERARDEIRVHRQQGKLGSEPIVVWLHGGDFVRSQALELGLADSGTSNNPVVWQSYAGERPRFLGGRVLPNFRKLSDPAIAARLPEAARGQVMELDLKGLGITNFGTMKSRGFSRPTQPSHAELFYDGKPMTLARWPNEGQFEKIAGFPGAAEADEHGGQLGKIEGGFTYSGDRPRSWKSTGDLWVHGYWAWDWANSYEQVTGLDVEKRVIKTAAPYGLYGFRKGQRFYYLNILEELDQPGEWYLDKTSGMLYFWPPQPSAGGQRAEAVLSLLDQPLVKFTSASYITVKGVTFEAGRADGITIQGGTGVLLRGCQIRNIGDRGVGIDSGFRHGVVDCDIFDTGDGGVSVNGGDRKTLTPGGSYVENCHFARQGRWSKCYVPAVLIDGVGQRVAHNLIHDHPHCAILYGGNDHVIEFNEIHHVALETGDVGAIYAGRNYTYRGNRISNNFIHHTGGVGMGSMGVYMDDCVSGAEISGNVFYKVQRAAFLGGGRDHQVINNIFVECDPAVQLDGRGLDKSPVWHDMVDKFMRDGLNDVPLALYRERYPAMKTLDSAYGPPGGAAIAGSEFKGVPPEGNVVAHNVCVGKWLDVGWHAKEEWLKLESNLVDPKPGFVGEINDRSTVRDFALKPESMAWRLGFKAIPVEQIGMNR